MFRPPAGLLVLVAASVACSNDARDALCTPDEPDRATSPDCLYAGNGKGPLYEEPECPDLEGDAPADCPSFYDVLDVLADPAKGNCTSLGCHGAEITAQTDIYLPVAEPSLFYVHLLEAEGSVGRPYVVPDDGDTPENEALSSWMICNLRGERGGGFPMPPPHGMPDLADIDVVEDWILCGAEAPAPCPAEAGDDDCVACSKLQCCPVIQQCLDDTDCAPCAACLATSSDLAACSAECDLEVGRVDAFVGCVSLRCEEECPDITTQ